VPALDPPNFFEPTPPWDERAFSLCFLLGLVVFFAVLLFIVPTPTFLIRVAPALTGYVFSQRCSHLYGVILVFLI